MGAWSSQARPSLRVPPSTWRAIESGAASLGGTFRFRPNEVNASPLTPEEIGLSSAGLERARAHVASSVERGDIAGAVVLASRQDRVAHLACIGLRDIEAGLPIKPNDLRIASMTKPLTSVGAMMLVEVGTLRLDDPVSRYIPEFADVRVFAGVDGGRARLEALDRPITVWHLLTQTSACTTTWPRIQPSSRPRRPRAFVTHCRS